MKTFATLTLDEVTAGIQGQVQLDRSKVELSDEVKEIEKKITENPQDIELWIQKGLALSKQKLFREAVEAYSMYISFNPFNGIVYRHRGHRLISVYRYHEAAADLEMAVRLDPRNWDSWYHLGLAHYLLGDYERAANAYKRCAEITDTDDKLVAVIDWYWMTLTRLGRRTEADALLAPINEDTDCGENYAYLRRILMYKGLIKPEELIVTEGSFIPELEIATQGYGLSNYYYIEGNTEKSNEVLKLIVDAAKETMWSAFGYLAALEDIRKRGLKFD